MRCWVLVLVVFCFISFSEARKRATVETINLKPGTPGSVDIPAVSFCYSFS